MPGMAEEGRGKGEGGDVGVRGREMASERGREKRGGGGGDGGAGGGGGGGC